MRAVLFDLDGTLLDLDPTSFLMRYFDALDRYTAEVLEPGRGGPAFVDALKAATGRMFSPHPGHTNRDVFNSAMLEAIEIDLDSSWETFDIFYRDVFPGLAGDARPASGSRRVVETALDLGLRVAVATNPIFPRDAIVSRLGWAGLDDVPFHLITSFEFMEACKPNPAYFVQTANMLGVSPSECLMVGDDRSLDMPAVDVGMRTYYVGKRPYDAAPLSGDLNALADLLPRLVALDASGEEAP